MDSERPSLRHSDIFSLQGKPPTFGSGRRGDGQCPRLAGHLGRRPGLLDYVLEPEFFGAIPQ